MAQIVKRGAAQWRVRIRKRGYPEQSKTFVSQADAQAWAAVIESEMARGVFVSRAEAESTTLAEVLDRYRAEVTPHKKGADREHYRLDVIKRHPLSKRFLATIQARDIAQYRDDRLKAVSALTVNKELNTISHVFATCTREWSIGGISNPVKSVRRPKQPKGRERRLEGDEETRLLAELEKLPYIYTAVVLALESGMRRGEIVKLRRIDISGAVATLHDTKNGETRRVPLSMRAVKALDNLPSRLDGRVFGFGERWFSLAFQEACQRASIEGLRLHDLRHEATSRFFERGLNIMEIAAITGHKTLNVLQRYTHLRPEDLAKKLG